MPRHLVPRNLFVGQRIPLAGVAHQNGTIRFGRDPQTSALDANCRAHDVDNLYVVDGSFFPSSARGEPGADDHGERAARRRPPAGALRCAQRSGGGGRCARAEACVPPGGRARVALRSSALTARAPDVATPAAASASVDASG